MVLNKQKNPECSRNRDNNNVGLGEDKISNLPDALIHHILSFLPTKCVMSTCILSKRWKYVPKSIPTLDFRNWRTPDGTEKEEKQETKWFMNFMDTLLFSHDKPNIQRFCLDVDRCFDGSRVNRWIRTIMKRKVEELCICMKDLSTSTIFPLFFFTCDSLTLLDLGSRTCSNFNIPDAVCFPKLKILRLTYIRFVDETSTRKLFSNCPILEELSMSDCWIPQGLCIANRALRHLSISDCFTRETTVKISAPNLLTISYRSSSPVDFVLDSFPSLVEADIDFWSNWRYPGKAFVKLFKKLSSAKHLKTCQGLFMVLKEEDFLLNSSLTFNNLIHLEVSSDRSALYGSYSISTMRIFIRFLQLTPNLESIIFAQSIQLPEELEDDGCWSLDPKYSLPHLKSIKFKYFGGEQTELNLVKLFLKYAGFLETITILASPSLSKDHEEQIYAMKLLLMFPRPANCVVKFLTSSEDT